MYPAVARQVKDHVLKVTTKKVRRSLDIPIMYRDEVDKVSDRSPVCWLLAMVVFSLT